MDGPSLPRLDMPAEWIFTTDPEDKGVREKVVYEPEVYDAAIRKP